jgi:hypothetical protein
MPCLYYNTLLKSLSLGFRWQLPHRLVRMRSPAEPSPAAQARSRARLLVYRSRRFNALSYSRTILLTACTALERSRNFHGTYCPLELRSVCSSSSVGPVAPSKPLSALGNACLVARCPAVGETNLDRGSSDHASMDKCVHCQPRALCLDNCYTVGWMPVALLSWGLLQESGFLSTLELRSTGSLKSAATSLWMPMQTKLPCALLLLCLCPTTSHAVLVLGPVSLVTQLCNGAQEAYHILW